MNPKDKELLQMKILHMMEEVERSVDSDSGSDSESSEISMDFNDDSLFSDTSSIASVILPVPSKIGKSKSSVNHSVEKKSRIPIRSKGRIENETRKEEIQAKPVNKYPTLQLSEQAEKSKPRQVKAVNFLAVDFSKYSQCAVCVYQGTDFPKLRIGERSTYVLIKLHNELPEISTPVCWNKTNFAKYNAGYRLDVGTLDFYNTVPHVEVFDMRLDGTHELIGIGFLQLQTAKVVGNVCIVAKDQWIPIYAENPPVQCGRVEMTVIFFNNEEDLAGMIRNPAEEVEDDVPVKNVAQAAAPKPIVQQKKQEQVVEEPVKSSAAVQADVSFDAPLHDDPLMFTTGDFSLPIEKSKPWGDVQQRQWEAPQQAQKQVSRPVNQAIDDSQCDSMSSVSFVSNSSFKRNKRPKMKFVDSSDLELDTTQSSEISQTPFKTKRKSKRNELNRQQKQNRDAFMEDPLSFNMFAGSLNRLNGVDK